MKKQVDLPTQYILLEELKDQYPLTEPSLIKTMFEVINDATVIFPILEQCLFTEQEFKIEGYRH